MGSNEPKLEWMYKGVRGLVDNEEYLTGRKIDKTFEIISAEENPQLKGDLEGFESLVPQSLFDSLPNASNPSTVTIDLAAKLREDPLYEIRVKQREERRKLLDNPMKLKKLKTLLQTTLSDDKHHNKSKKRHQRRDSSSSSSSGDSSSDSSSSDDSNDRKKRRRDNERRSDSRSGRQSSHHSSHHSSSGRHSKNYDSKRDKDYKNRDNHRRDDSHRKKYEEKPHSKDRRDDRRPPQTSSKPISNDRHRNTSSNTFTHPKPPQRTRLSAEDMERRRKEMETNAVWRESQRKTNVKSYEDEERHENQVNASAKSAQFIKPLLKSATESDSLEDRIRQKRFTSQRGYNLMDNSVQKLSDVFVLNECRLMDECRRSGHPLDVYKTHPNDSRGHKTSHKMGSNEPKLEWMYKGVRGLVDNEEYLTGRKIDKTFEIISAEENPQLKGDLEGFESLVPQSLFDSLPNASNPSTVTIDLAAKLREDPLYEIRVKQREERRKLLDNPMKLKKLKTLLQTTLSDDKHHNKSKKRHKRRGSSSSSGDSSSDSSSSSSDDSNDRKKRRRDNERRSDSRSGRQSSHHSSHHSSSGRHSKNYDSKRDKDYKNRDNDRRDDSHRKKYEEKPHSKDRRDDRRPPQTSSKPISNDRHRNTSSNTFTHPKPPQRTRLSAEDMERRRKEMETNAVWRESQRKTNVKSYEDEERHENQVNASAKSAQFIKPLLKSATESDSLEDRIRQKRFTSQRGYNSMDSNFARK
ncbi:unnamed protein product [Medioppia subpectinata]|uniref:Uncharacterized protein n=1 Tax=Medioppia subpectinata TaxID=1979941 RepID=A0A7R9PT60_9ACAR|nr:unnamed protein product [Medioppia subpectinata]CAG2100096.1 unnamed protein product [Medioppia subpectinata]